MICWINMRNLGSVPMRVKYLETKVLVRSAKYGSMLMSNFVKLSLCAYLHHSFFLFIYKFYILLLSAYAQKEGNKTNKKNKVQLLS